MATKKISELASKGAELEATDLLEISEYDGVSAYTSKKVTGAEIKTAVQNVLFYNDFASFPGTGSTGYLYIDKATEFVYVWDGASYSQVNSGSNFANTNLTFDNNRTHDLAGYKATFDNAELKIIADANTSGDVPFEVTQTNGTDSILKVRGDKAIIKSTNSVSQITTEFTGGNSIEANGEVNFSINTTSGAKQLLIYINYFGNALIRNNTGLLEINTSGKLNLNSASGYNINSLPTSDAGLSTGDLFTQTATELGGSGTTKVLCVK